MGTLCGLTVTTILLFFLLFVSLSHSFYLPGVAPRDFQTVCSLIIQTHFSKSVLYFILSPLIACFPVQFFFGVSLFSVVFVVLFEFSLLYVEQYWIWVFEFDLILCCCGSVGLFLSCFWIMGFVWIWIFVEIQVKVLIFGNWECDLGVCICCCCCCCFFFFKRF